VGHRSQPDAGPDRTAAGARALHLRSDVTVPVVARGRGSGTWVAAESERHYKHRRPWRWPRTWQSVRRCPSTTPSLHGWTLAAAVELQHAVLPVIAHAALRKGSSLAARLSRIVHQCVRLTRSYNRATPQPP
jgi:hypothetical protein